MDYGLFEIVLWVVEIFATPAAVVWAAWYLKNGKCCHG
jgi:hypothetical protein